MKTKTLEVTGCQDCPLREYTGGPEECAVTGKNADPYRNVRSPQHAWAVCPLKKGDVTVTLITKKA